jgi:hypothetical protein
MTSKVAQRWVVVLASGILGAAGWFSRAAADGPQPMVLNLPAPELVGREWRNTPGNAPVTLTGERGKVTILHFWTFG